MTTNEHIDAFISSQTVASVCSAGPDGALSCFSCYYAYQAEEHLLHFKSDIHSLHMQKLQQDHRLAGTILPDKLNKLKVQGIQFEGEWVPLSEKATNGASRFYHKKYPFALAMPGTVFTIRLNFLKMTDSALGFGTKLLWHRSEQGHEKS